MVKGRQTSGIRVRKAWVHLLQKYGFCIGELKTSIPGERKWNRKIPAINLLDFAHSACRCKKFGLKCLTELWELYYLSYLCVMKRPRTKEGKKCVQRIIGIRDKKCILYYLGKGRHIYLWVFGAFTRKQFTLQLHTRTSNLKMDPSDTRSKIGIDRRVQKVLEFAHANLRRLHSNKTW